MKKFLVEDISVGASKGGIACGPVSGLVIAEICLKDTENGTISYHALTEVGGTLSFTNSSTSTFDIQVREDYEDKASWATVESSYAGGYSDYDEFYEDLTTCDEEHQLIWKLLAYLVRADWDEIAEMKANNTGKSLDEIEIPVCDAEQEYLDSLREEASTDDITEEQDSLEAIRDEYVGLSVNTGAFDFPEDESPEGYYSCKESFQDEDGNMYICTLGFDLNESGTITNISGIRCKKLLDKDTDTYENIEVLPAEAYKLLRSHLEGLV